MVTTSVYQGGVHIPHIQTFSWFSSKQTKNKITRSNIANWKQANKQIARSNMHPPEFWYLQHGRHPWPFPPSRLRGRTTSPEYTYSIPVCHIFALSYRIKHYIMLSNSMSITIYHICSCIYNLINVAAHIILLPTCTFIWPAQLSHMDWMRPM